MKRNVDGHVSKQVKRKLTLVDGTAAIKRGALSQKRQSKLILHSKYYSVINALLPGDFPSVSGAVVMCATKSINACMFFRHTDSGLYRGFPGFELACL
jgi:hypothetical protein